MDLLAIVTLVVMVADRWVGGRVSGMKILMPARIWAVLMGLVPGPKAAVRPVSAAWKTTRKAKRGYYYVNTSR